MLELLFIFVIIYAIYRLYSVFKGTRNNENESFENNKKSTNQKKQKNQSETEKRSDNEILGLSDEWTQKELKDAYRLKCNQLHPDKWAKMPNEMSLMMEQEFKVVQQAYKNLLK